MATKKYQSSSLPAQPETLVPRLGETLIEKGIITSGELMQALDYQKVQNSSGNPLLLGEALLKLELLSRSTLDAAITEQISLLQSALTRSNEILERRVLERTSELQEALEGLKQSNRIKADFIANMSHELRTPLVHMIGYIEFLKEESLGAINKDQLGAIKVLEKSNIRLGNLIDNLLLLSFDTEESMPLQLQATQIRHVVKEIVENFKVLAQDADISLKSDIEENLPAVYIDPEKLGLALSQLVENAIKFNQEGGNVLIRAHLSEDKVAISILDTGIGIPQEKLNEIQRPFFQLDTSSTREYGGVGLGLNLAKRIVEAHNSSLNIESKPGRGSRVSFSMPLAEGKI